MYHRGRYLLHIIYLIEGSSLLRNKESGSLLMVMVAMVASPTRPDASSVPISYYFLANLRLDSTRPK